MIPKWFAVKQILFKCYHEGIRVSNFHTLSFPKQQGDNNEIIYFKIGKSRLNIDHDTRGISLFFFEAVLWHVLRYLIMKGGSINILPERQ